MWLSKLKAEWDAMYDFGDNGLDLVTKYKLNKHASRELSACLDIS